MAISPRGERIWTTVKYNLSFYSAIRFTALFQIFINIKPTDNCDGQNPTAGISVSRLYIAFLKMAQVAVDLRIFRVDKDQELTVLTTEPKKAPPLEMST